MSYPIKVAIVGATGRIGSSIVSGLLRSTEPRFEITALIQPSSLKRASMAGLEQSGVIVALADLIGPEDDLVSVLTGIDVVVCILPPDYTMHQIPLANAAVRAGVKRFVPNMWATCSPPRGIMKIRGWKEDVIDHLKTICLPCTIIDIGFWHEVMIPRIDSGRLDHVALYSEYFFVDEGLVPCTTIHIDDVGLYVARIISDPRTINRNVFAYGEVTSQNYMVQLVERLSGEKVPCFNVTADQVAKTVNMAKFLGYLDGKDLYPNFKAQSIENTFRQALGNEGVNPAFGNEGHCARIASALSKWK